MISCDTNILLHSFNATSASNRTARNFLRSHGEDERFAICELVLVELYVLLRNPAVVTNPLSAESAASVCQAYRRNPHWRVVDYPGGLMEDIWLRAAEDAFGRRAIFDARLALTLRYHGVTEFATANVRHFADYGFSKIWNPLQ